jgi:predicted DNA-binding protein
MFLDDAVIGRFKDLSDKTGRGYQTLINEALNTHLGLVEAPLTLDVVRRIVREELASQT